MSSKYNRFLITSCISVMTLSLYPLLPAHAGFEWTAPEQAEPPAATEHEIEMPKGSALPVPPPAVQEEILNTPPSHIARVPEVEKPVKSSTPVLKTKVMDQPQKNSPMPTAAPKTIQNTVAKSTPLPVTQTNTPVAKQAEAKQPEVSSVPRRQKPKMPKQQQASISAKAKNPAPSNISEPTAAPQVITAPEPVAKIIVPPMPVKTESPVENAKIEPASSGLKINPYPKNIGNKTIANPPVVLGNDDPQAEGEKALQSVYEGKENNINLVKDSKFSIVEGFGTDMPLALALSQIVPPSYAYAFGEGVNPGTKVSWSGGKPWNEILSDVITPLGITYEIKDQKLSLITVSDAQNSEPAIKKKLN